MSNASVTSVREALEAKKVEIEAALAELDRIESEMGRMEALAGLRAPPPPQVNGKSYSQAVFDALSEGPKTREELSQELRLTPEQIHNAATSHRLRKVVTTLTANGHTTYILNSSSQKPDRSPTLTEGILQLLRENGAPMASRDIVKALDGRVQSSAKDFSSTVASTLSFLLRAGRLHRDAQLGYFIGKEGQQGG